VAQQLINQGDPDRATRLDDAAGETNRDESEAMEVEGTPSSSGDPASGEGGGAGGRMVREGDGWVFKRM
jgi:hypothetical protein